MATWFYLFTMALSSAPLADAKTNAPNHHDVVVYGGTAGGVVAALQVAAMGHSVVLIEPSRHLGGLTSGGLGATDIGNKAAIGGLSREFYRRVFLHYSKPNAWTFAKQENYTSRRQAGGEDTQWTFEPRVAEMILRTWLHDAKVPVFMDERLDLAQGVKTSGTRITTIVMESGKTFVGKMFIDATYEGDLMAKAGVGYHVGRESNQRYGETLNGVQVRNATHHQFVKPVDPYIVPGDRASGLLPGIHGNHPEPDGSGDNRVQAYNYRLCATDVPANRRPWPKPRNYDPARFELLLRNFEAGDHRIPWNPILMPNRKTDSNNNYAFSTDNIGMNHDYPNGDYKTRDRIVAEHENYQKGLMWTLANSPRVPPMVQSHFQTWGLAKDEFLDNDNWPHQLYVREARRMVGAYVMTEHECRGTRVVDDPVGLAAYNMDSHNVQRYVDAQGHARNEGDIQVAPSSPYGISYRAIIPRKGECANLLVPVCLSASHIAYGSIRMEPVFMILGQSAATAAVQAIAANSDVQDLDYARLRQRLLSDHQILDWRGPKRQTGIDRKTLPGVVVDDNAARKEGSWLPSSSVGGFVGEGYIHDNNSDPGSKRVIYSAKLPRSGRYRVLVSYTPNANRAPRVSITIRGSEGDKVVYINQRAPLPKNSPFVELGIFTFSADREAVVELSNRQALGYVVADAVQWIPAP